MIKNIPFTYLLKHIPTNKYYYGVRFKKGCHPNDLWTKYFTSSKKVKGLIKRYGKKSFIFEIRKKFKTVKQAMNWENKVLKRMKVIHRDDFLNLTDNKSIDPTHLSKIMMGKRKGKDNYMFGKKHSKETIRKMKLSIKGKRKGKNNPMFGKKHSKETKDKIRLALTGNTNRCFKNNIDLAQKSL
jgi:hypothetical protein